MGQKRAKNDRLKSKHISNYVTCKLTEHFNKKISIIRIILENVLFPVTLQAKMLFPLHLE